MSSATPTAGKQDKELSPAESGKILQNPQLPPNNKQESNPAAKDRDPNDIIGKKG